jgi:hypothetical protein
MTAPFVGKLSSPDVRHRLDGRISVCGLNVLGTVGDNPLTCTFEEKSPMLTFLLATVAALVAVGVLGYVLVFRVEDLFLTARERRAEREAAERETLVRGRVGLDH